ncbi:DUF167 family protein [Motiliproteus sp. SC1-56]|uniref:DUF167 family protein n=1 Tax=Motiliproteus sp. SC1-56 TaxID=2799565 RepID=UPI001A8C9892|nr:DUF167 family protein [Motiliproteus sp. SC1-56]
MSGPGRWQGEDLYLACYLQPRASRDEIAGLHGDSVKIRLSAPPVDGQANAQLIRFMAKAFGVGRQAVEIVSGERSRRKQVRIQHPSRVPPELGITRDD